MDRPIAHRAPYQEVARRVRRLIYRGDLPPGPLIDEQRLTSRFGISRTPRREALHARAAARARAAPRAGTRRTS